MKFDVRLYNVVLLGLSFMLIFTAFQTMGNIQKTIMTSITEDDPNFQGKAYYSLAIIYFVFSLANWASPSIISLIGPKCSMMLGGITYLLFIASFAIPKTWLLYLVSVLIGCGAAMIWTGQGNCLTLNSTPETISRNSGIFWAMLQLSMFIGNLFVYFSFKGKEKIDHSTRQIVIWTLSAIALGGVITVLFIRNLRAKDPTDLSTSNEPSYGPLQALVGAGKLFVTKKMLLLSVTFFYTGLELGFYSGVYSSCIGFTQGFSNRKELVGISGIFIGVGEVIGGTLFGILGTKTSKLGRDPVVTSGFVIHAIGYFLVFLNLPNNSPFADTNSSAFITSNSTLAIFCSFLLGFGDACYNTQIYSLLGSVYSNDSAAAFAIFKFTQSVGAALCFFYAESLVLYGQLGILIIFAILGTISFVWVEWSARKEILTE